MQLEYDKELFCNREEEIKDIENMVCSLNQSIPLKERIIFIFGPVGIGKTWLLRHLCYHLSSEAQPQCRAFTLYVNLTQATSIEAIIEQIANYVACLRGKPRLKAEKPSLDELSRWLTMDVENLFKEVPGRSFVLCLDSIDQVSWDFLSQVEDYIIAPMLRLPSVLLLISGRRYIYPWRTPEVRLYYKTISLKKLTPEKSEEQLKKLREKKRGWDEIQKIEWLRDALGYPWLNFLAATEENVEEIPEKVIKLVFEDLAQNEELLKAVEQLSILRSFDEARIALLVNNYARKPFAEARKLREELMKKGLARWVEERGGYVLDEGLKLFLEIRLQKSNPVKWVELHQKALRFYSEWVKASKYGKIWEEEVNYHQNKLGGEENG
ncbi:MAG: ATP-binding protein [Candidatus Bathyarchaeia archaeon]